MNRRSFFLICFLCLTGFSASEGAKYGLDFSQNDTDMSWNHALSGFDYVVGGSDSSTSIRITGGTNIGWRLIQGTGGGKDRWITGSGANLSVSYPLSERTRIGITTSMSKSSDNFSSFGKKPIVTQNVSTSFSFRPFITGPFRSLSFNQSTGQSIDRRLGQRFSGVGYSFGVSINPDIVRGLSNGFSYSKSGNTSKRGDLNAGLSGTLGYTFFHNIGTNATYSENRGRQNYLNTASKLNPRIEKRFTKGRSLSTGINITEALSNNFSYSNSQTTDTISDDPNSARRGADSEERSLGWNSSGSFKPRTFAAISAKIGYGLKKKATLPNHEGFRRDDLDNRTEDISINSSLTLKVSDDHSVTLSGNIGRNSYDTPSRSEMTDKDNLTQVFLLSYSGALAGEMKLSSSMRIAQTHLVFLNATNSANNRWSRDYTLEARTNYQLWGKVDMSHNYSVAAYRLIFDYDEDYFTSRTIPKSNIRRRWSMQHTIGSKVTDGLRYSTSYSLWLEDFGNLFRNDRWIVVEDKTQHTATFSFSYYPAYPALWLSIAPGTTYQLRKDRDHLYTGGREERKLVNRSIFKTFSLNVSYTSPGRENTLSFNLSHTARESLKRKSSSDDNVSVSYSRTL